MNSKIIVYVDDAGHAQEILRPLSARQSQSGGAGGATHWVLVACAPRMTHRISKWVSHSARENWRTKWADKLFAQLLPRLQADGAQVSTVLAKGPLSELLPHLHAEHGADAQVVDARRPRQEAMAPAAATPAPVVVVTKKPLRNWSLPGSLASIAALMFLVAE